MYLYMLRMHTLLVTGNIYNTLNLQIDYHCDSFMQFNVKLTHAADSVLHMNKCINQVCQRDIYVVCHQNKTKKMQ